MYFKFLPPKLSIICFKQSSVRFGTVARFLKKLDKDTATTMTTAVSNVERELLTSWIYIAVKTPWDCFDPLCFIYINIKLNAI